MTKFLSLFLLLVSLAAACYAAEDGYQKGKDKCDRKEKLYDIILTARDYGRVHFKVPDTYFTKYYDPEKFEKKSEWPNFISLTAVKDDMAPMCVGKDYNMNDSRAFSNISVSIKIDPAVPEGFKNIYRSQIEREFTVFRGINEAGFKMYDPDELAGDDLRQPMLFVPPENYFGQPAYLICGKAMHAIERFSWCKVRTQFSDLLQLEYHFKPSDNFSNIKKTDEKVRSFVRSLITKEEKSTSNEIITFDQKICPGTFVAEIGGVKMQLPRDIDIYLAGDKRITGMDHPKYNCALNFVASVADLGFERKKREILSVSVKAKDSKTTYDQFLGRGKGNKVYKLLSADIEKLDRDKTQALFDEYIINSANYKTLNGEAILIHCDDVLKKQAHLKRCETKYIHPSGLFIWNSFSINGLTDESLIAHVRENFDMITSTLKTDDKDTNGSPD